LLLFMKEDAVRTRAARRKFRRCLNRQCADHARRPSRQDLGLKFSLLDWFCAFFAPRLSVRQAPF
jgi:hypothetical protein